MVYDITDRTSFDNVKSWFTEIEKYASENVNKIIIGNKSDLEDKRAVTEQEGKELASSMGLEFLETSAKNALKVDEGFIVMAQEIKNKIASSARVQNQPKNEVLSASRPIPKNRGNCC